MNVTYARCSTARSDRNNLYWTVTNVH